MDHPTNGLTIAAPLSTLADGGSRKGSKGTAVHGHFRPLCRGCPRNCKRRVFVQHCHWKCEFPGRRTKDGDPRARRSATSNGHARARRAGILDVLKSGRLRSAPKAKADRQTAKIAVTGRLFAGWGVACCLSSIAAAEAAGYRYSAVFSFRPRPPRRALCSRADRARRRTHPRKRCNSPPFR